MSYFTRQRDPLFRAIKEWDESKHPRDREGQFTEGGGSGNEPFDYAGEKTIAEGGSVEPVYVPKVQPGQTRLPTASGWSAEEANAQMVQGMEKIREFARDKLGPNALIQEETVPWSKERPRTSAGTPAPEGINRSGFVEVGGNKFFAKVQDLEESQIEAAVWDVAQKLGWPDMSRPTLVDNPRNGRTVLQTLLPPGTTMKEFEGTPQMTDDKQQRMLLFDYAIGAGDRHWNNYWVDTKKDVHGIDYARSFQMEPQPRGGLRDLGAITVDHAPVSMVEHVLAHEQTIKDAIPAKGGYETPRAIALVAVSQRMNKLRTKLAAARAGGHDIVDISWIMS